MFGTLKWRIQEASRVLLGIKTLEKALPTKNSELTLDNLPAFEIDEELKNLIDSTKIEFLFSEFGENRVNAGGNTFSSSARLNPSLATLKHYFPNAKYTVYSDFDLEVPGVALKKIISTPIIDKDHPRYNYRTADYFKFKSLLESDADFKCVIDTDMFVASPEIFSLVYLTKIFGFCAPYNSRNLLKKDMKMSLDTGEINDLSQSLGHSYNQSPMTLWKNNADGERFYQACCNFMKNEPSRASLVMWKAAKETGVSPYLLPSEWCVCAENIGIGDEIILHIGHKKVKNFYNVKL